MSPTSSRMWDHEELAPHFWRSFPKLRKVLSWGGAWTPPLRTSISANYLHYILWEKHILSPCFHTMVWHRLFFFFLMNNSNAMQFPPFSAEPFSLNFWVFCMEGLWKRRTCIPFPASLLSGWENCLTSLSFSFLICRTEITILFFLGLSLVIWWLRLCTSNARGPRGNPWSGN